MIPVLSESPARRGRHTVIGQWVGVLVQGSPEHGGQGETPLTQLRAHKQDSPRLSPKISNLFQSRGNRNLYLFLKVSFFGSNSVLQSV